ncbi:MAG TPA: hypothetical protein VFM69_06500 [Pricia sp.]|nr:hypothetical protein [Pricia sp.]
MKTLTVGQIQKAGEEFDYLMMRPANCRERPFAINSKVLLMKGNRTANTRFTQFISYRPISFMEYISHKCRFVNV